MQGACSCLKNGYPVAAAEQCVGMEFSFTDLFSNLKSTLLLFNTKHGKLMDYTGVLQSQPSDSLMFDYAEVATHLVTLKEHSKQNYLTNKVQTASVYNPDNSMRKYSYWHGMPSYKGKYDQGKLDPSDKSFSWVGHLMANANYPHDYQDISLSNPSYVAGVVV